MQHPETAVDAAWEAAPSEGEMEAPPKPGPSGTSGSDMLTIMRDFLRAALLAKFDISPETYRQQFRSTSVAHGENPTETYHRLKSLYRRWLQPERHTKEQIGEAIILEQLLRVLPADVRT
uniref:SCAN box domain-containing protein n=1 Tax=Oryzias sinensis TaxID=183150 RepID=A0A8C7WYL5_9TELE